MYILLYWTSFKNARYLKHVPENTAGIPKNVPGEDYPPKSLKNANEEVYFHNSFFRTPLVAASVKFGGAPLRENFYEVSFTEQLYIEE